MESSTALAHTVTTRSAAPAAPAWWRDGQGLVGVVRRGRGQRVGSVGHRGDQCRTGRGCPGSGTRQQARSTSASATSVTPSINPSRAARSRSTGTTLGFPVSSTQASCRLVGSLGNATRRLAGIAWTSREDRGRAFDRASVLRGDAIGQGRPA